MAASATADHSGFTQYRPFERARIIRGRVRNVHDGAAGDMGNVGNPACISNIPARGVRRARRQLRRRPELPSTKTPG
jgi:hypothetical protein